MLLKNKLYFIGIILSVLMILQGCNKTWDEHYNTLDETSQKDKIISELEAIPEISKFTEAVKKIDTLVSLIGQNRLYTVFALTNEAFETINPDILNNEVFLKGLIMNHFINGKYKYKDFTNGIFFTFNNKYLSISVDASHNVLINENSSIVQSDFLSKNGMIHLIDKPLVPLNDLYEYFQYNKYSTQFGKAIPNFTKKEFLINLSRPTGQRNDQNKMIYDSVFHKTNPFLYEGDERIYESMYNTDFRYVDISDEDMLFTFVFPVNFESVFQSLKTCPFLNKSIPDYHWSGPLLVNFIMPSLKSKEEIISDIERYHSMPKIDTIAIQLYLADLLKNHYVGNEIISNGMVHLVDGFEYDLSWIFSDQGNNTGSTSTEEDDYHKKLIADCTYSAKVDTVKRITKHVETIFYNDTITNGYETKYGEWVNFELEGDFYPVNYRVMVRGKNTNSGTFKIEVDGEEIGQYDFSTAPSGALDTQFDEIGIVGFKEIKSSTNLKFTFINTHPGNNKKEQLLWIREIKFSPIIK